MKYLVCLAGFSSEVVGELQSRSPGSLTEDKSTPPIVRPMKEPLTYRPGMSEYYLKSLCEKFDPRRVKEDFAIILVYVDYGGDATEKFLADFFPFALVASAEPFYPHTVPFKFRKNRIRKYVTSIEDTLGGLRARARIVRDQFSGNNFSPLLLPLKNFQSKVLEPNARKLFESMSTSTDLRAELCDAESNIKISHPLKRKKDKQPFFEDDRHLRFCSPGRNRHGMARVIAGTHEPRCLLSARVRFGGPFDPLFHYDCAQSRGGVAKVYPNCHGESVKPGAKTHVNIAPNDAIR